MGPLWLFPSILLRWQALRHDRVAGLKTFLCVLDRWDAQPWSEVYLEWCPFRLKALSLSWQQAKWMRPYIDKILLLSVGDLLTCVGSRCWWQLFCLLSLKLCHLKNVWFHRKFACQRDILAVIKRQQETAKQFRLVNPRKYGERRWGSQKDAYQILVPIWVPSTENRELESWRRPGSSVYEHS